MKLRTLEMSTFKNLRNFSIDFAQTLTTVLLGQNGTGKSNLLEALIIIFRDLDLGVQPPAFQYKLHYECRGNEIYIDADPARSNKREQIQITIRNPGEMMQSISYRQLHTDSERRYLPSYVFGYYSGPSNRMEKHFDRHQRRFYEDLIRKGIYDPPRPLLYARPVHSQFAMLSFFLEEEASSAEGNGNIRQFLEDILGVQELSSVLFVMHKPPWDSKEGDPRFWNARGVVRDLLDHLYEIALAPMRLNARVSSGFVSTTTLEHLYLYLNSVEKLKQLYAHYGSQQKFFKALESTYISEILSEVRIRLQRRNADGSLTFRDLSEGEQQLLMVLGLLRFTKEDEALFLLDEPDTHLNPTWGVQYLEFMQRVVGDQPTSQVIMSTHNPLVISSLERQEVRIMQRNKAQERIYAEMPRENPRGMGVAGILTSELFGLRSSLDLPTQKLLDEQRVLAAKEDLNLQQRRRLAELTDQLDAMGFSVTDDDSLYALFLKKMAEREDPAIYEQVTLSPEQQEERSRMVEDIISELIAEGHWR